MGFNIDTLLVILIFTGLIIFISGIILLIVGIAKKNGKRKRNFIIIGSSAAFTLLSFVCLSFYIVNYYDPTANNRQPNEAFLKRQAELDAQRTFEERLVVKEPIVSFGNSTFSLTGTSDPKSTITIKEDGDLVTTISTKEDGTFSFSGDLPTENDITFEITDGDTTRKVKVKSIITIKREEEQRQNIAKRRAQSKEEENQANAEDAEIKSEEESIEKQKTEIIRQIEDVISNDFRISAEIDKIVINKNMGRDDGSFVALIHIIYSDRSTKGSTRDMIEMHSNHIFAKIVDPELVSDGAIFWQVPFYETEPNEVLAKFSFIEEDGKALVKEESFYNTLK